MDFTHQPVVEVISSTRSSASSALQVVDIEPHQLHPDHSFQPQKNHQNQTQSQ